MQERETILVVEDGPSVRRLVCQMLTQNGYSVLEAADGKDALDICNRHHPSISLILTDVVMPGMSGRELAKRLLRAYPHLRFMFMSGYPGEGLPEELQGLNITSLQKPFTSIMLIRKVREVLESPWLRSTG